METKKITCCDLMVGDYVIFDPNVFNNNEDEYEPTKEPYPCRIESGEQIDKAVNGCYSPIPLTAEVLEKNGFTRLGTNYILEGEHFGLDNPSNPNNYLDNYWLRISINAVKIEYVHELQRALRFLKINKDIAL